MVNEAANSHTPSRQLGDWCAGLAWTDVPVAVRAQVPLRLLDTVGLIFAGASTVAVQAVVANTRAAAGAAQSTILGGAQSPGSAPARVPAAAAALVHGVAAHCRDFDDTFVDSVVHPGSVVVPAALAVAESVSASNEDFGAAIIAGYEIAARVGAVAGRRFHARGLHATGLVGPLAAAATAGRLLGLSGERIAWAFGLAASMSGGLMAFLADGSWSKWLHAGWAAHGGIVAAELAAHGFRGPEYVLQGRHDLYSAFLHGEADTLERSGLTRELGRTWQGALAEFKYYPCAHVIQPYIDAVLQIVMRHDLRADDVESIECAMAPWAVQIVAEPRAARLRVDTELEAMSSLPYLLAMAVAERRVDLSALEAGQRGRADLRALAQRITHREDPGLGRSFDGGVELRTRAGARHTLKALTAGADAGKLQDKFVQLAAPLIGSGEAPAAAGAGRNRATARENHARAAAQALLGAGVPDWRIAAKILADAATDGKKPNSSG